MRPRSPGAASSPALAALLVVGIGVGRVSAHVPQYDCKNNCCHAKYDIADVDDPEDAVSQAFYFTDEGGVEFDVEDFNTNPGEGQLVYVDAGFRDEYPRDAYELYIGCGGCAPGDGVYDDARKEYEGYGRGKFEPFTQHDYHSYFVDDWRTFNTSALADCQSKHWTIRLVRNASATTLPRSDKLFWTAVVGKREWFDPVDLLLYPMYVWRNHQHGWNELYTFWWVLGLCILGAVLLLFSTDHHYKLHFFTKGISYKYDKAVPEEAHLLYVEEAPRDWRFAARSVCYALAMLMIVVDLFETLLHGMHSVFQVQPSAESVLMFVFLVLLFGKVFPLLLLSWIWDSMRRNPPSLWAKRDCCCRWWCRPVWHPVYAHVNWAFLEILTGLSFFFLFGLGFYVTPLLITVAGLFRLGDYHYIGKYEHEELTVMDTKLTLDPVDVDKSVVPDAKSALPAVNLSEENL